MRPRITNKTRKTIRKTRKSTKTRKFRKSTKKGVSKFIKLNCSPENKNNALNSYTCYSDDDLYKLREVWNARHPDRLIKTSNSK